MPTSYLAFSLKPLSTDRLYKNDSAQEYPFKTTQLFYPISQRQRELSKIGILFQLTEQENPPEKKKISETKINHLPDKEFINIYVPNIGAPKYIKQILTDLEKLTII